MPLLLFHCVYTFQQLTVLLEGLISGLYGQGEVLISSFSTLLTLLHLALQALHLQLVLTQLFLTLTNNNIIQVRIRETEINLSVRCIVT